MRWNLSLFIVFAFLCGQAAAATYSVQWGWPFDRPLFSGYPELNIFYYWDHGGRDYMNGGVRYGNHTGTDLACGHLRNMDRGVEIRAVADGIVLQTAYTSRADRQVPGEPSTQYNRIWIRHRDGRLATYGHLRGWSVMVRERDSVKAGQPIALIGASGTATFPHLHIETQDDSDYFEDGATHRDPFTGPNSPETFNLWKSPPPYAGSQMRVMYLGVYSAGGLGHDPNTATGSEFWHQEVQPCRVYGATEARLAIALIYQGPPGSSYRLDVKKPDGTVFQQFSYTTSSQALYDSRVHVLNFAPTGGSANYGTWTVDAVVGGSVYKTFSFLVGAQTKLSPWFSPISGISIWAGMPWTFTLSTRGTAVASYNLIGAPAGVTVDAAARTVRTVNPSNQPYRNCYFQVQAVDAEGYADSFWVHMIDMNKPYPGTTEVEEQVKAEVKVEGMELEARPNPFRTGLSVEVLGLRKGEKPALFIYNVSGKCVARLNAQRSALNTSYAWDAKAMPAGIYLARLVAGTNTVTKRLLLVK